MVANGIRIHWSGLVVSQQRQLSFVAGNWLTESSNWCLLVQLFLVCQWWTLSGASAVGG